MVTSAAFNWARIGLTGLGQIMFQQNALTGAFFLAGIAVASPLMALGAAAGDLIGTATARALGYDEKDIAAGLYGFNSGLVGIATYFYLQPIIRTHGLLAVGCVLAAVEQGLALHAMPRMGS